jgi:hypothetical protein
MNPTGCCAHTEKEHCPGDVTHTSYKDQMRMNPNPHKWKCPGRHCIAVLCCCVGSPQKKAPTPEVIGQAQGGLNLDQLRMDVFGH